MNDNAKSLALRVADHIERLDWLNSRFEKPGKDNPHFSMQTTHYECGAPACIAGWVVALGSYEQIEAGYTLIKACELLDLDAESASVLFSPEHEADGDPDEYPHDGADYNLRDEDNPLFISAERAARQLRHVVEHDGRVDWGATP